ncbi:DUF2335 domain-containing protein [Fructobacillus sp. M2-14]|uniref:DUF2335 domain-containing protein n=1 Tax=Fructobacillus broussonetiae TaxID=2713173 RepID=A0ABS5R0N9_9LACO|nr:DUF2335 domain-containing protein [Fructobacillus broussonetiae]MBS9339013.1 DUF2335 domain-containing protein [Fructobacillus broussonetiae]
MNNLNKISRSKKNEKELLKELALTFDSLPNPELLEKIELLAPGTAEQVIKNRIDESKHRREMEMWQQSMYWKCKGFGYLCSMAATLIFPTLTFLLIKDNHPVAGSTFGSATLIAVISLFLNGAANKSE